METPDDNELITPEMRKLEREWEACGRPTILSTKMSGVEYYDLYKFRFAFPNRSALDQVKRHMGLVACPACKIGGVGAAVQIEVTRLCVTIEKHPMQDRSQLVNAVCHNCGFQQMWPFKPVVRASDVTMSATAANIAAQGQIAQARMAQIQAKVAQGLVAAGSLIDADVASTIFGAPLGGPDAEPPLDVEQLKRDIANGMALPKEFVNAIRRSEEGSLDVRIPERYKKV